MRILMNISVLVFLVSNFIGAQAQSGEYEQNWPQWRGPDASGVAPAADPPTEWGEEKNVKWKVEIPVISGLF